MSARTSQLPHVFMSRVNKGLVEFSIDQDVQPVNRPLLKVEYKIHTTFDTDKIRDEFQSVIARDLGCLIRDSVQDEDGLYLYLIPCREEDQTVEVIAG